ncbi:plasma membrane intrinsic protein 1B [Striga asiatica]|uniref:Plasma membrane intrinsic protein 1B n=1 Tax=Striga asiatica TaxID=4170 RepID=A0A5A7QDG9_STRAF|nr:plasma membrane intrinsic protein 1B [Striga asiatica]
MKHVRKHNGPTRYPNQFLVTYGRIELPSSLAYASPPARNLRHTLIPEALTLRPHACVHSPDNHTMRRMEREIIPSPRGLPILTSMSRTSIVKRTSARHRPSLLLRPLYSPLSLSLMHTKQIGTNISVSISPSLYLDLALANSDRRREATSESPNDCPSAAEPPLAADHIVRPIGCPQIPNTHTNRAPLSATTSFVADLPTGTPSRTTQHHPQPPPTPCTHRGRLRAGLLPRKSQHAGLQPFPAT